MKKDILHCVKYHHNNALSSVVSQLSDSDYAYIVYEADNIAAAVDRRKYDEGEMEEHSNSKFDKEMPLQSVFRVFGGTLTETLHYPLRSLDASGHFNYPVSNSEQRASSDKYKELFRTLEQNFSNQSIDSMSVNELLRIYEDTVSYIPSSTVKDEVADISLYMHSKITAAIAVSMAMYFEEQGIINYRKSCLDDVDLFRSEDSFCMISGDISGIQQFIYTIPSKGALRSLRGRSFYLEILMEQILDELLDVLGLTRVNLIYNGGGHFYIIGPNTPAVKTRVLDFQTNVNRWLLERFGTQLYVALGIAVASANDLKDSAGQRNIFRKVSQSVAISKSNRYTESDLGDLFNYESAYNTVDGERECSICRISSTLLRVYDDMGDSEVCATCAGLFRLGKEIVESEDSLFVIAETTNKKNGMDIYRYIGSSNDTEVSKKDSSIARLFVVSEKELEDFKLSSNNILRIYAKNKALTGDRVYNRLWIADHVARKVNGQAYDFEELAGLSGSADKGIKRLGVLRADVDNLGAAFIGGFITANQDNPYKYGTLSRYADLSRDLAMFFKVAVNKMAKGDVSGAVTEARHVPFTIWDKKDDHSRKVHVIYSGGDDVFLVGAWDQLLELSIDIHDRLEKFTDGKITMSAGLALFSHNYPINQMAHITGLLESEAKNNPQKDSIALFGFDTELHEGRLNCQHVYKWNEFIANVLNGKMQSIQKYFVLPGITEEDSSKLVLYRSFVYKLMNLLIEILRDHNRKTHINIARLLYLLARLDPGKNSLNYDSYREFVKYMSLWIRDKNECKALLTSLNLIVYYLRDSE